MFLKAKLKFNMVLLENNKIKLRALESTDLEFLFHIENNESFWEVSNTLTPFSKDILKQYLANAHQDIYEAKQLRLVITDATNNENIGLIDLFDFNPQHQRAGIGILILEKYQHKGYAGDALKLCVHYAFKKLNLHQLYANIISENNISIALFEKMGFQLTGHKKDWLLSNGKYKDVKLYQLINA